MNKTKIEWCDFTYNPVTGCLHGCEYCYARRIAQRFCGDIRLNKSSKQLQASDSKGLWILEEPFKNNQGKVIPLPVGFEPTLHRYRLPMPAQKKKPARIFVCSMADLFGDWVPDEWIKEVLTACAAAPWHAYLFLTKNPKRYCAYGVPTESNFWYGISVTGDADASAFNLLPAHANTFVSIEPLHSAGIPENHSLLFHQADWIIAGAETGSRRDKIKPKREWIQSIVDICKDAGTPLFMKDSLLEIWEDPLIREYPKGLEPKNDIIPRCKECEHSSKTPQGKRGVRYECDLVGEHILGRYTRTSPPWCPKREAEEK